MGIKRISLLTKRVLLVKNKRYIQEKLDDKLRALHYQVDQIEDASLALTRVKAKSYTLIVIFSPFLNKTDETLIQVIREYEWNQSTPLIFCTNKINLQEECAILKLGVDKVLQNPISKKSLQQAIQACFLKPGYRRKFYFQMRMIQKKLQTVSVPEKKTAISIHEERELAYQLHSVAKKLLQIVDEYQQWPVSQSE